MERRARRGCSSGAHPGGVKSGPDIAGPHQVEMVVAELPARSITMPRSVIGRVRPKAAKVHGSTNHQEVVCVPNACTVAPCNGHRLPCTSRVRLPFEPPRVWIQVRIGNAEPECRSLHWGLREPAARRSAVRVSQSLASSGLDTDLWPGGPVCRTCERQNQYSNRRLPPGS